MNRLLRTALILTGLLLAVTLAACAGGGSGVFPIVPSSDLVESGRPLYAANCGSCHGDATMRPPDSHAPTHQADGHTWHHPDRLLLQWILDGVPQATHMPRFRGTLSETEARAVVAYIKTFWPESIRQAQAQASEQYERQLSESR